jgi:hypothetical protein
MLPEYQLANAPPSPTSSEKSDKSGFAETDTRTSKSSKDNNSTVNGSKQHNDSAHGSGGGGGGSGGGGDNASQSRQHAVPPHNDVAAKHGLYYKAMLEAKDNSGWTPLMVASSRGEVGVMNFLIGCGANVKACSRDKLGNIGERAEQGLLLYLCVCVCVCVFTNTLIYKSL